jgi:hypothetical protein
MKMTFLLFCVIILNDTRFFSTSFAVHCCLVWCVGVPQSFLRSIMNVNHIPYGFTQVKKIFQTWKEIPIQTQKITYTDPIVPLPLSCRTGTCVIHFHTTYSQFSISHNERQDSTTTTDTMSSDCVEDFTIGGSGLIHGLLSESGQLLNGQVGIISKLPDKSGRIVVRFDNGSTKRIKTCNVKVISETSKKELAMKQMFTIATPRIGDPILSIEDAEQHVISTRSALEVLIKAVPTIRRH